MQDVWDCAASAAGSKEDALSPGPQPQNTAGSKEDVIKKGSKEDALSPGPQP